MRDKTSIFWYILILNIIINITIVLFPHQKVINVTNKIVIEKKIETEKILEVNHLLNSSLSIKINGKEKNIEKNQSNLKNNKLGTYYVLYKTKIGKYREIEMYQKVKVVDKVKPSIFLEEGKKIEVPLYTTYQDPGYLAIDNYDGDITKKVKRTGKVNTEKEGTYTLKYQVEDSSSNKRQIERKVIVKKDAKEINKKEDPFDYASYPNTAVQMDFYKKGIQIKGYMKKDKKDYTLKIGKKTYPLSKKDPNFYEGKIDLTTLKNGNYTVKIEGENLLCKIDDKDRLQRAHIGKKLITFSYSKKGEVKIKVEPFQYKYDILIDPGHGGEDTGAMVNGYIEKNINLKQSLYEKKRFEEHGLKVKMIREDDSYGIMMKDASWHIVTRRAFAIGYYGSVSKISYSNHHNSTLDSTFMGWEILVPASLSYQELKEEHKIIEKWNEIYELKENHTRMYARDYKKDTIYNKINGQIYQIKNYYAVNRIPYKSYFTKVPIFEGSFMSNKEDFTWYYEKENYKKLSEVKIKTYVEALGYTYKKPKEGV